MFDWTPVLFSPPGDLSDISNQSVGVGAIGAVEAFQHVQIKQFAAIIYKVLVTLDRRYLVDRKAHNQIYRDHEV
jgi:hypothetical protein